MLFSLNDVSKRYGSVQALRGLTVSIEPGATGLLGPNGAGKTTFIRCLLGLTTPNTGTGEVLGFDIRRHMLDIRQAVGFMPEDECLFAGMPGVEAVAYAGTLVGMARKDALQRSHEVLDYVGLGEARYRKSESYSTGMKQRLKLASAIVHDPKLLILDEPTNGMDPRGREEMIELAKDLSHKKGMSLLFSSHLLPDVEAVCDHVVVMGEGRLLTQGNIGEMKGLQREAFEVKLKGPKAEFLAKLAGQGCEGVEREGKLIVTVPEGTTSELFWRVATEVGGQIRHLRPSRGTLEEVFLRAVAEN